MDYLYTPIEPTRLYVKQCSHCDLKYFGKTVRQDIEKYSGSGVKWKNHLSKHNAKSLHIWNSDWYYDTSISTFALEFSKDNNIVESETWANLIEENGLDGFNSKESKDIQARKIYKNKHHLQGSSLQKKLLKEGRHNTQNPHILDYNSKIQKALVDDGSHIFLSIDRSHIKRDIDNGTHIFKNESFQNMMKGKTRCRVENGEHNFLGGDLQRKRIEEGSHHFLTNHPNKQKWVCEETGIISTKSGFTCRARKKGMDKWPYKLKKYD